MGFDNTTHCLYIYCVIRMWDHGSSNQCKIISPLRLSKMTMLIVAHILKNNVVLAVE